jgi:hypothetical protein
VQYRVSLVALDERYKDKETVATLQVEGEKGRAFLVDPDPRYERQLQDFCNTLEQEGIVLLAESLKDGKDFGPFDMWITRPTKIDQLDAMIFPDMSNAVFDFKVDGKYVRLQPVFGTSYPRF